MLLGFIVFLIGYTISMFYTSILYHRGLTHQAFEMSPGLVKFVEKTGMLVTGIDPKAWICMHRLHHKHSDTVNDPHSPLHAGFWNTFFKSHQSFSKIIVKLIRHNSELTQLTKDIPFDVHYLNKKGLWWLPFFMHIFIGLLLVTVFNFSIWVGVGYILGICGHPIQGFLVNAFGHTYGYRTYDEPDRSTNNTFVAWFVFGEGYQNNHHRYPSAAKFSVKPYEIDPGYIFVKLLVFLKLAKLPKYATSTSSRA